MKTGSGTVCLKTGNATLAVSGNGEEGALGDLLEPGSVTPAAAKSGAGSAGRRLKRGRASPRLSPHPPWSPAPSR